LDNERKNLLDLKEENWIPPTYSKKPGLINKLKLGLYSCLDLQYSTIRRDLSVELPRVQGTALDVGCGIQPHRDLFPLTVKYIGIDTSDSKEHFGYETPDTIYYSGDTWPVRDQQVDFVLCTETLEHVPDPSVFLKEAARVLKSKGSILLTVPFAVRWHFIPYDYWRYTPSSLHSLLIKNGFVEIKVHARGNSLTVACYKTMGFIFGILSPADRAPAATWALRLLGILCLPFLLFAVILANLSKNVDGTVDCLGYTVLARRS
jgi:SAM-dependent methyltransferase